MLAAGREHFVRVGVLGQVGRFVTVGHLSFPRGTQVVCRTNRGLETGTVIAQAAMPVAKGTGDGAVLRSLTPTDELWLQRLRRNSHDAFLACEKLLQEAGSEAVLIEVEQLFDGQSLFFYFLQPPADDVEPLISSLAEAYESVAKIRDFTAAVTQGCGPDCGTATAAGCDTHCASCSVVAACRAT